MKFRADILKVSLKELGVREHPGRDDNNPRVLEYFEASGHDWVEYDETAWCAAFVGWVLHKIGLKGTGKLNARSYLEYGVETKNPEPGDIAVFWRENPDTWKGHVAIFLGERDGDIYVLGGNQSNGVNVRTYPQKRLLGYREVV